VLSKRQDKTRNQYRVRKVNCDRNLYRRRDNYIFSKKARQATGSGGGDCPDCATIPHDRGVPQNTTKKEPKQHRKRSGSRFTNTSKKKHAKDGGRRRGIVKKRNSDLLDYERQTE